MFACEAHYHKSCRAKYITDPSQWRSSNEEQKTDQEKLEAAHKMAYMDVCQVINKDIILNKKTMKLTTLTQLYISKLQSSEYPNPNYRSEKLKTKLENDATYSTNLSFCKLDSHGQFTSYIVYSSDIDVDRAVKSDMN